MILLRRSRNSPPAVSSSSGGGHEPDSAGTRKFRRVPLTRVGGAWLGGCFCAVVSIAIIVFLLQNSQRVRIRFLWLEGTLPLAVALLIAATVIALLAASLGGARIVQLRRLVPAHGPVPDRPASSRSPVESLTAPTEAPSA